MAWRSRKILALIPPEGSEDSDVESDENPEIRLSLRELLNNSSCSSSPQSLPSGMYDLLKDLSDDDETVCDEPPSHEDDRINTTSINTSVLDPCTPSDRYPCMISETPSTSFVRSPLEPGIRTRRTRFITNEEFSPIPPPPPTTGSAAKKRKAKKLEFQFKKVKYTGTVDVDTNTQFADQFEIQSPQHYFQKFFDDDLLDFIVDMTNLYSVQNSGKSIEFTKKELEIFLGIEIIKGIVKMPATEDYWSNNLRFESIASSMSLKRYKCLKRYLHFCDNSNVNTNDRYHKVAVVIEQIRHKCLQIEEEKAFAIDEMIIPYKGKKAGSRKQYIPKKPHKWGFKFLCVCN